MTEGHNDGMKEPPAQGPDGKMLSAADMESIINAYPAWAHLTFLCALRDAIERLRAGIKKNKVEGWKNPFIQLDYGIERYASLDTPAPEEADAWIESVLKAIPGHTLPRFMAHMTKGVVLNQDTMQIVVPATLDKEVAGLPEAEREAYLTVLGAGFELPPWKLSGKANNTPFAVALVFAIRPLTVQPKAHHAFFPVMVGLDFTEGNPSTWSEEDREAIWPFLLERIDILVEPHLKALKAKGEARPAIPKPDRAVPIRAEYFHAPGRLFDTPRNAAKQGDLPAIGRWYMQAAFNRTVGMAAAALTKTDTRATILDWQSAPVEEVADLVFCRSEEGTPAHGQNREDILKAFEALRAIPVPIVKIDWKQIGTDRNPRWVKEYKLRVASLLQSYGAVFIDKITGKEVRAADPTHKKNLIKAKADRRKTMKELVAQNPAVGILASYPPDRYTLTRFEWRWNTDIAEDFICPQVALDGKGRPRLKLKKGRHIEGSRFINLHLRYFAVQKHLREAGMTYAPRLLDLIVSEKTHITSRGKGAVWIEIQADKVIKWLDLWTDYQDRPKHVLEDHIANAVMALIKEKVILPESGLVPQVDKNPDRRKTPFYRWKVAELWSTVALVTPEEAKEVEDELVKEAEAAEVAGSQPKADQAVLPGMEAPSAQPIPEGYDIRAARKSAKVNLRDFARIMDGREAVLKEEVQPEPSFKTWSMIETGQRSSSAGRIPETVWQRVRDFIAQHRPKAGSEG